jgi:heme o synthase
MVAEAKSPSLARDLFTLTKPGITGLIVLVAIAGYFVALPARVDPIALVSLAGLGALASAGSGMLNQYLDRDVDVRMRRTQSRPLAGDRVHPPTLVLGLGVALVAVGVAGASLALNLLAGVSVLLGAITYVVVYTAWLKRRTSWNIVIGGFAGSAPALAGGAAAVGTWTPGVLALALLVFLWTPPHFWSLALLLKDDYARAGLPMLPKMDDPGYSGKVVVVSAALLVPSSALVGWLTPANPVVFAGLLVLGALFVALTLPLWNDTTRRIARRGFIYSGPYLLGVVVLLTLNAFLVHPVAWALR